MVKGLLHADPQEDNAEHTASRCEEFLQHCAGKIAQIYLDLDAVVDSGLVNVTLPPLALCSWMNFSS